MIGSAVLELRFLDEKLLNPFLVSAQTIRLIASIELLTTRRTMLLLFNKRLANLLQNRIFVRALEFGAFTGTLCTLIGTGKPVQSGYKCYAFN